jgi:hypothetical protein
VRGKLLGSTRLASGRFAMVDNGLGFSLVSWRPVPGLLLYRSSTAPVTGHDPISVRGCNAHPGKRPHLCIRGPRRFPMFGLLKSAVPPARRHPLGRRLSLVRGSSVYRGSAGNIHWARFHRRQGALLIFRCSQKNLATESPLYMLEYDGCGDSIFGGTDAIERPWPRSRFGMCRR